MESHQQRGHNIFENMRTNYLQVWKKYFPIFLISRLWKDTLVTVIMCFIYSRSSGTAYVSQWQTTQWEILSAKWIKLEAELLRERAIFGPGPGVMLNQDWAQDAVEGPNRTRARIRRKVLRRSKQVQLRLLQLELMRMLVSWCSLWQLSNALQQLQGLHCLRTSMSESNTTRTEGDTGRKVCLPNKVVYKI